MKSNFVFLAYRQEQKFIYKEYLKKNIADRIQTLQYQRFHILKMLLWYLDVNLTVKAIANDSHLNQPTNQINEDERYYDFVKSLLAPLAQLEHGQFWKNLELPLLFGFLVYFMKAAFIRYSRTIFRSLL